MKANPVIVPATFTSFVMGLASTASLGGGQCPGDAIQPQCEELIEVMHGRGQCPGDAIQPQYEVVELPWSAAAGDVNSDGHMEVVTVGSVPEPVVKLGKGHGTFTA